MAYQKSKYTDIDLSKYENGFQDTDAIIQAAQKKAEAEAAYNNIGDFQFSKADDFKTAYDNYMNRGKFSYDLNADALYQQYKDNFITQGKLASMDVMGQASAMTGGYGNSYAATVGNQVYQSKLSELNNIVPELYQMALDRYNTEGAELRDKYNLLAGEEQTEYGKYMDTKNTLLADRDYYDSEYDETYSRDYTTWNDNRTYDTSQYWSEYNAGYQAEQDAIANKIARDAANNQATIDALQAALDGRIDPDKMDINQETGEITYDGASLNGDYLKKSTNASTSISGFKTDSGKNFEVTVGGNTYKVQNGGKANSSLKSALDKSKTSYGNIYEFNGSYYVRSGSDYYKIEGRTISKTGYNDFVLAMQGL